MLSSRHEVDIRFRHIFSCELNDDERDYILEAFEEDCGSKNIFIDGSTSESRSADAIESALDVLTCVRPTHDIYSIGLGRYVSARELLGAQGIWQVDSENIKAFAKMTSSTKFAQDMAGNAFSSTACQAAFLASLVVCDVWREVHPATPGSVQRNDLENPPSNMQLVASCSSKRAKVSSKQPASAETTSVDLPKLDQPSKNHAVPSLVPTRRLRKKTSLAVAKAKPKRQRGVGAGNSKGKGKSKMATIYEKEAIMAAYDDAVEKGIPKPKTVVSNMPGYFKGCMFDSKWGRVRKEQKWSLLVTTAPELMKKHHEVPNCIRRITHMKTMKHSVAKLGNGSDQELEQIHMPLPLQMVVEDMLMDRICNGEELNMQSVKSILVFCTELWNLVTGSMRDMFQDMALAKIHQKDAELAALPKEELATKVEEVVESAKDLLRPIRIAANDATLLWLVEAFLALCCG
eukprot:s287_g17.t1